MKHQFDTSWKEWIHHNLNRGCDKEGIVKILLDNDFHPQTIIYEMGYQPTSAEVLGIINQKLSSQLFEPAYIAQKPQIAPQCSQTKEYTNSNTMSIHDHVHLPFAQKVDTDKAHMYLLDGFLTEQECKQVITHIRQQCRPSTITISSETDKDFRTSQTCDLSDQPDGFIKNLDRRIADYIGYEEERAEGIQGQYYQVGNQFKTHTDYFQPNSEEFKRYASEHGQRTWTFMIYLNKVAEGGQTEFTELGLVFTPKQGQAVIWNNLDSNDQINNDTLHWAKPIIKGEKYIITKWFRTGANLKTPFIPYHHKQIPAFTPTGFKKSALPADLYQKIYQFYQNNRSKLAIEENDSIGKYIHSKIDNKPSKIIDLNKQLRTQIFKYLLPGLEKWSGQKLEHTAVYGIREYQNGAMLDMHVDRYQTHIISAIINVDQDVNNDWSLNIYDHYARLHKITLKPGEILFYESASLAHGRPEPLDGKRYANIFAHTMPINWKQKADEITEQLQSNTLRQRNKFS
ncbi:MAG: 2OG-Fe(II) oxygenase [Cocleimonas sp.]